MFISKLNSNDNNWK